MAGLAYLLRHRDRKPLERLTPALSVPGDVDPQSPAMIYWFEAKRDKDGVTTFTPHEIDNDSGIGTQFVVADFNGDRLPDVVTSNKKGTYIFLQQRAKK